MAHPAPYPRFTLPARSLATAIGDAVPGGAEAVAHLVFAGEELPAITGIGPERSELLGFSGATGSALTLPTSEGPLLIAVGAGPRAEVSTAALRDAAAAAARAVMRVGELAIVVPETGLPDEEVSAALLEGAALARYVHRIGSDAETTALTNLTLIADAARHDALQDGLTRGHVTLAAAELARDLAGTPGGILTATRLGEVAQEYGERAGLTVEVFDEEQLVEMRLGGLLGVNLGSHEPPVMIKLRYEPAKPTGHVALVGKGIMYDSGGLALKPADAVHATMKNDMTGAAAILGAMTALRDLGCTTAVTGYLMCTDNMPGGKAMRLGDIIVMRDGRTVEVTNTDAEGRLVMADALVLATEEPVDAVVNIATLTGAAMRALGMEIAAVLGNNDGLITMVKAAADRVDEPVWELPLDRRYRAELDSPIADIRNMGGPNAGAITAALFLETFVKDRPWAHLDIAGTAQSERAQRWHNQGTTGFGARLLVDLAMRFDAGVL
ncbi:leucyl aminopeptidase family protein [Propioniciclava coleopterorum]|uniref:Probable cytosol aminopeptidase n=1 Tax=Propioniciclava coleopterorum TaxID=2714937 RepID=A0A6G7Y975_9ACTN|nr:M17 family metallopeptidase [Propioniciclava coleopterorum]QIK73198.1 leucyl aminopeptidase family protein [Propioniciclava coleopterorum]